MRTILLRLLTLLFFHSQASVPDTLLLQNYEQQARKYYGRDVDSSLYFAKSIINECLNIDVPARHAFAINWIGICYMKKGMADSAENYYRQAIEYGLNKSVLPIVQKARLNRSINFFQQGQYEKAAKFANEALVSFEKTGDSLGMAHAYYNLANCLFRLDRFEEALTFYNAAEPIYKTSSNPWPLANLYNGTGAAQAALLNNDSALFYYKNALDIKMKTGGEYYCAAEYMNIANLYTEMRQADSAFYYSHKANYIAAELGDIPKYCGSLLNISRLHYHFGSADSSLYYIRLALPVLSDVDDGYLKYESYMRLAKAYEVIGQFDSAYYYINAHIDLRDSIKNEETSRQISELEKQYRLTEKDRQILEQDLAITQKTQTNQLLIAALFVFLLILIFIIRWYNLKKRKQAADSKLAMMEERTRIAMDLHDHVGAELTVMSSTLDTHLFKKTGNSNSSELQELSEQIRGVNSTLRETVWSIRNESITVDELLQRADKFAKRLLTGTSISFKSNCDASSQHLSSQQALTLYRICQEGITNAFKYAEAQKIELLITMDKDNLQLQLSDDGKGFNPNQTEKGYGLKNMEKRAEQINGTFKVESTSKGTILNVTISVQTI